jgi:hypothetical protein
MNWNRVEFCYGQRLELRACDHAASRWVPVSVCGVLVAPSKDPYEATGFLSSRRGQRQDNLGRPRPSSRTIFCKILKTACSAGRQIADSIHAPDARATE